MKKSIISAIVAALVLATASWCPAQVGSTANQKAASADRKAVVVVSFSGYSALARDVGYVGKLANRPELAIGMELLLSMATQGRGLQGLDKDRPWGAVLEIDEKKLAEGATRPEELLSGYAFLPVADFDQILQTVKTLGVRVNEQAGGVLELQGQRNPVYVKHQGKWAFLSARPEMLAKLPGDPLALLAKMNEQYDLAVRVNVGSIPEKFRQQALEQIAARTELGLVQRPGESDPEFAGRKLGSQQALKVVRAAFNDLEQVALGWKLDADKGVASLDFTAVARAESPSAKEFATLDDAATEYSGFLLADAAMQVNWCGKSTQTTRTNVNNVLGYLRGQAMDGIDKSGQPEAQQRLSKELFGELLDLIRAAVESGKADFAASAMVKPESVQVIAAANIADGDKADKLLRKLVAAVREENPAAVQEWVKLDVAKQDDVRFHKITIPIPPTAQNREPLVKMFGEMVEVVVGIGKDSVFLSIGRDSLPALQQAITKSRAAGTQSVAPFQLLVALEPMAKFAAGVTEGTDKTRVENLVKVLETSQGKDRLRLIAEPIERGFRLRLELEEGYLKAIGTTGRR